MHGRNISVSMKCTTTCIRRNRGRKAGYLTLCELARWAVDLSGTRSRVKEVALSTRTLVGCGRVTVSEGDGGLR